MKRVFITGSAGFIGFHLVKLLLNEGFTVHGYDGFTDYYDVGLKHNRHQMLLESASFTATEGLLENQESVNQAVAEFAPDVIIHLAAQAGVRHSLDKPRAYLDSNVIGTFNIMEAAHHNKVEHLLMASTSSVYGANSEMPFNELEKTDSQLTIYAATKKANESMAHAYAHLWNLPTTMLRFFTVYGPWGRPDLAFFKFVDAILDGRPIDVYNHGDMYRDFTYVEDVVRAIRLLIDVVPQRPTSPEDISGRDSLSRVAPYRVVNIGNSKKILLMDFIKAIEEALGQDAKKNFMPMQMGDVPSTWADTSLLTDLTGYQPHTDYRDGIVSFVKWYRDYYKK